MAKLTSDLVAETADLYGHLLAGLNDDGWQRDTPTEGWAVRDQVSHLAYFDSATVRSATEPEVFTAEMARPARAGGRRDIACWRTSSRDRSCSNFTNQEVQIKLTNQAVPTTLLEAA
jgi:hypothetical protein